MERQGNLTVVVALDPPSYRSAIGSSIQLMRPHTNVEILAPAEIADNPRWFASAIVICSCRTPSEADGNWIEFYPYSDPDTLRIRGRRRNLGRSVELDDLLAAVDDVEASLRDAL